MPDTGTMSGLPDTTKPLEPLKMASKKRVLHTQRGFYMSFTYAEQVMRDHCTITWDIPGQTIRDTTDEERIEMRAEQANRVRLSELKSGMLGPHDIHGLKFERPKSTNYRHPLGAYEAMESPLGVRVCRWPRVMQAA